MARALEFAVVRADFDSAVVSRNTPTLGKNSIHRRGVVYFLDSFFFVRSGLKMP